MYFYTAKYGNTDTRLYNKQMTLDKNIVFFLICIYIKKKGGKKRRKKKYIQKRSSNIYVYVYFGGEDMDKV